MKIVLSTTFLRPYFTWPAGWENGDFWPHPGPRESVSETGPRTLFSSPPPPLVRHCCGGLLLPAPGPRAGDTEMFKYKGIHSTVKALPLKSNNQHFSLQRSLSKAKAELLLGDELLDETVEFATGAQPSSQFLPVPLSLRTAERWKVLVSRCRGSGSHPGRQVREGKGREGPRTLRTGWGPSERPLSYRGGR